jgi:2'-5' RNA ligase
LGLKVEEEISKLQAILKEVTGGVSWVSPDKLHLTLRFFGAIEEARIPGLLGQLRRDLCHVGPFSVTVRGVGVFPDLRNPRVIWVGLQGSGISALYGRIQESLEMEPDRRPFSPHITIGRVRHQTVRGRLTEEILNRGEHHFGSLQVGKLILYRSDLSVRGSVYTSLGEIPLAEEA